MQPVSTFKDRATAVKNVFTGFGGGAVPLWAAVVSAVVAVLAIAAVLYLALRFLRKERNAFNIPYYIAAFFAVYAVLYLCQDYVRPLWVIANYVAIAALVCLLVLFAPQLQRGIIKLMRGRRGGAFFATKYDLTHDELHGVVSEIVRGMLTMSKKNIGALIVIAPAHMSAQIIESGMELNALVSAPLLESIFNTKAPMHDGAGVVRGNRILAAGCFLPLSQNPDLPSDLGTRHRAALGVSEGNDVMSLIVSEQTGIISVCRGGVITRYYNAEMLTDTLEQAYGLKMPPAAGKPNKPSKVKSKK